MKAPIALFGFALIAAMALGYDFPHQTGQVNASRSVGRFRETETETEANAIAIV